MHYTINCNTQSSAPEDGRDQRPKHVELTGINKPLLWHLVDVYIIYINDGRSKKLQISGQCIKFRNCMYEYHFPLKRSIFLLARRMTNHHSYHKSVENAEELEYLRFDVK